MGTILGTISEACWECITLNGSAWIMSYGIFVLYYAVARDRKWVPAAGVKVEAPADFESRRPAAMAPQTLLLSFLSDLLTPRNYIFCLRRVSQKLQSLTGIDHRGLLKNIFVMFVFYYLVVSAPAAAMVPTNYSATYNLQSVIALLAMMLTNAIGDYCSIRLTIRNVKRIAHYHRTKMGKTSNETSFSSSLKTEAILYGITIFDTIIAFLILVAVLLLTSVYFGVSIGEYQFEFSQVAYEGAKDRLWNFWATAKEPYWLRDIAVPEDFSGPPMLLIYSATSFLPTAIILFFALFWTLVLPLRIIHLTEWSKLTKVVVSELIVVVICSVTLASYNAFSWRYFFS